MKMIHQHIGLLAFACFALALSSACVDDSGQAQGKPQAGPVLDVGEQQELLYSLSSGRTPAEERLAGELESLLPGGWVHRNAAAGPAMDIIFLGHDAVTGDIAILMVPSNDDVVPSRITLEGDDAFLYLPDSERGYVIEHIDADRLELFDVESDSTLVYLRDTSSIVEP